MKISMIAFTAAGLKLGEKICAQLAEEGEEAILSTGFGEEKVNREEWTERAFAEADALAFISASGIAVRSIAPHLVSKDVDPAVVCLDERGTWCIPLVSGHIGGANELSKRIADIVDATAAITTATDVNGIWVVDTWATSQGFVIGDVSKIKDVSAKLLTGANASIALEGGLSGALPEQLATAPAPRYVGEPLTASPATSAKADIHVGVRRTGAVLDVVVPCLTLGIGCRKDTSAEAIESGFSQLMETYGLDVRAVSDVASIELKAREAGLLEFCEQHALPFVTYRSDELNRVEGGVSSSEFVQSVTGVASVCEQAALANGGALILPKTVINGVTFALAERDWTANFNC